VEAVKRARPESLVATGAAVAARAAKDYMLRRSNQNHQLVRVELLADEMKTSASKSISSYRGSTTADGSACGCGRDGTSSRGKHDENIIDGLGRRAAVQ
jgi:hypothetical protein